MCIKWIEWSNIDISKNQTPTISKIRTFRVFRNLKYLIELLSILITWSIKAGSSTLNQISHTAMGFSIMKTFHFCILISKKFIPRISSGSLVLSMILINCAQMATKWYYRTLMKLIWPHGEITICVLRIVINVWKKKIWKMASIIVRNQVVRNSFIKNATINSIMNSFKMDK